MSGQAPQPVRTVRCPGCGQPSPYSPANAWRPFCSARCREGDLGAWASEGYRVPEPSPGEGQPPDSPGAHSDTVGGSRDDPTNQGFH